MRFSGRRFCRNKRRAAGNLLRRLASSRLVCGSHGVYAGFADLVMVTAGMRRGAPRRKQDSGETKPKDEARCSLHYPMIRHEICRHYTSLLVKVHERPGFAPAVDVIL